MPNPYKKRDALKPTLDIAELGKKLKWKKQPDPPEAQPFNRPGRPAARMKLPWAYDLDYGWTPKREKKDPRPPLNLPPYYSERFTFRTGGLAAVDRTSIHIDLRSFPRFARVFLWVPAKALRQARYDELLQGTADTPDGIWASVPATPADYNQLFGEQELASVTQERVLVELTPHRRAVLDQLEFDTDPQVIEFRYAVSRKAVRPKSQYVIHFGQFMDGFLVAEFEHVFQTYHPYDIPLVGDWRTKLVYRRSSREVSNIPPMALAFFDTWEHATAAGFDPAPRSFAKHFTPSDISDNLGERILAFVNDPKTGAKTLKKQVVDNVFVDAKGDAEQVAKRKLGIQRKTAERVIEARDDLPEKQFATLEQIDKVHGMGPDTMSDLITSFLIARGDDDRWYLDEDVLDLLPG